MPALEEMVFSGNRRADIFTERKDVLPRALKIGLGAAIFFSPVVQAQGNSSQINVVSAVNTAYNVRTTVYTNKEFSDDSEAILNMTNERQNTVTVQIRNAGVKSHALVIPEDDFYEDDDVIELIPSTSKSVTVNAIIHRSSYGKNNTLDFKDEV
ncbi:hypothetical protein [Paenibacillus sp. 7541]|uniref:hypothetical protein n=1 Tax=Paenibacillus sp. 7541 TaxID=2026236 RepID=UPI000BA7527F|nr:hypothetical protein [Paenibacillus sp. 7541]PAK51402.1 hypothetical protein CHH75_14480 [Paenibacillus sp. 7541]